MTDQIDGRYLAQEMPKILLYPHLVEPADKRDADGNLTGKRSYQVDFHDGPGRPGSGTAPQADVFAHQ